MTSGGAPRAPGRLLLLATGLLVAAGALVLAPGGTAPPPAALPLPLALLAAAFVLAECGRLHVEVRRSAATVSLSDVAVVLALLSLPADDAVRLRCAACLPVLVWLYRRSALKLAVNLAVLVFETAVAAVLLDGLRGPAGPLEPRTWLAALVALQVATLVAGLAVASAIWASGEHQTRREVLQPLGLAAGIACGTWLLGAVSGVLLAASRTSELLLVLVFSGVLVAYRGYSRLRERQQALESVYALIRTLDPGTAPEVVLAQVLAQVPGLVRAARASVLLADDDGWHRVELDGRDDGGLAVRDVDEVPELVARVLAEQRPRLVPPRPRRAEERAVLAALGARELLLTPLPADGGAAGVVVAVDRMAQVRRFRRDDLLLFETLALHSGVALASARLVARLRHDAEHDRLTGLLDRRGFSAALARAGQAPAAVVLLDLAGFADVNEVLGHSCGDDVLRTVAARVREQLRDGTAVARLSADEFAVLLQDVGEADAVAVGERLLDAVQQPLDLGTVPLSLEAGAGIAVGPAGEALLRKADVALHAAKARGGLRVHSADLEPDSARRLAVGTRLRVVLADPALAGQLEVHYQPKAEVRTGAVVAVEALVRWRQDDGSLLPPGEFVPLVESTGLLRPLTLHVLGTALRDAERWHAGGLPLSVAVNLSPRCLLDDALVDDVRGLLAEHAVPAPALVLEITESAVMEDPERAGALLGELAGLGVRLSVDDFGTGYSSLSYLSRLPVNEVKVDRSFVGQMTADRRDRAVVRSVVDLGHSLGLTVVAEGVEDDATWRELQELGCDLAQGFLLSPALPADGLLRWLAEAVPVQRHGKAAVRA